MKHSVTTSPPQIDGPNSSTRSLRNHTQPTKWYVPSLFNPIYGKERALTIIKAPAATGGKKQKKKWSKGKVKDKAQHAVVLDKQTNDKLQKDVQSYRLITVATLVDRLKINGSLARKALADLEANGQIKKVVGHSKLSIYTRAVGAAE
ncbi:Ribosomal protein S25 [Pyrenophora tritici-repentis]|nr:Ribosomal protein S25 [Pyrenophora tritici-repentis]